MSEYVDIKQQLSHFVLLLGSFDTCTILKFIHVKLVFRMRK
jgi:hypothetical protein